MNIVVRNLSREVTNEDLQNMFRAFGDVTSATVIRDKLSDESRGFGFVEMPSKAAALSAIADLNGKELKGQKLNIAGGIAAVLATVAAAGLLFYAAWKIFSRTTATAPISAPTPILATGTIVLQPDECLLLQFHIESDGDEALWNTFERCRTELEAEIRDEVRSPWVLSSMS